MRESCAPSRRFVPQDIRHDMPEGPFDLVLCRNLVLTYFEPLLQMQVMRGLAARLAFSRCPTAHKFCGGVPAQLPSERVHPMLSQRSSTARSALPGALGHGLNCEPHGLMQRSKVRALVAVLSLAFGLPSDDRLV